MLIIVVFAKRLSALLAGDNIANYRVNNLFMRTFPVNFTTLFAFNKRVVLAVDMLLRKP
jgi:hypothetical protein